MVVSFFQNKESGRRNEMIVLSRKMGEKIIDNLAGLDQPLRETDPNRSGFFYPKPCCQRSTDWKG